MQRWLLVGGLSAALLIGAAPTAAAGYSTWRTAVSGRVLHGGATLTERMGGRVRLAVAVTGAPAGARPVMEVVGAACGTKGQVLAATAMSSATPAGRAVGVEILTVPQTALFNAWVAAGRTVSVHVVSRAPTVTQSCGSLSSTLPTSTAIVTPSAFTPTDLASGYTLGKAGATVTVEAWEDFQCPYCRLFTAEVQPQLVTTYVETGQVRFVFRDYAFLGPDSVRAAVAAELAERQGKFWPYHDCLFANQLGENAGSFTLARLEAIAAAVGLNLAAFDAGLALTAASATYAAIEQATQAEATQLGIRGTPTVVVNGKPLQSWDWATVQTAINAALAMP